MDDQPLESIIEHLFDETDWLIRGKALRNLIAHGEAAVPYLERVFELRLDPKAPVNDASGVLIRNLGAAAVPFLLTQLKSGNAAYRREAIWLLMESGNRFCTTTRLTKQVLDDRNPQLPDWAQSPDLMINRFRECLSDTDLSVRFAAASALEEFGHDLPATVPVFIETLLHDSRHNQNWAALRLGRIGEPAMSACDALNTAVGSEYQYTRLAAKNALTRIRGNQESVGYIREQPL
ncbi:HEAT repeat domain-containing protein [Gimesia sp.]|uniref:HEAT repeat domain-containing protein n=1 Tax=Gimesia sp. TaxID=2024833 RepID=UPI000C66BF8B|nr:HEAT repeat domain-containing protein [Gimesia sp.]MAX38155.1 hypothetical protein [Gimesia sp.]|tara:strand:- start:3842 stop:4546 length:705 start_codon:yes stop_codon:yes gene_type:complete